MTKEIDEMILDMLEAFENSDTEKTKELIKLINKEQE